tara:strand:+ start:399 stop:566 length:168 start_codon:yes stop_codon:yes gene_type:complete
MAGKMDKRIANIMAAMRLAKDYEMKTIWSKKLQELFKIRERKAHERFEHKSKLVH